MANGIKATIIDNNPHNIDYLRKFGYKVYYGDITNANTLKSAGAEEAKILVITMNDRNQIDSLVNVAKRNHPHLKLIVRGIDIAHALELKNKGVDAVKQETFGSAVSLGIEALKNLDFNSYQAQRAANTFNRITSYNVCYTKLLRKSKWDSDIINTLLSESSRGIIFGMEIAPPTRR